MKYYILLLAMVALTISCKEKEKSEQVNEETEEVAMDSEQAASETWEILFDGTSFDAWKGYLKESVPETWKIEDGAMVFYPPADRPEGESYNIVTRKEYTSFVLSLEWKVSPAGNSGIFWAVVEDEQYPEAYQTGPEIQVLDNKGHPDASDMSHQAGSLYDMVAASQDVTKPAGEWNSCVITVDYNSNEGSVVLNDVKIVEFTPSGEKWDAMVADSKFADWEGFAKTKTGKIGLQDHGDIVYFRNIKVKEL